ncbi:MAG: hypothetical protein ACRD2H_03190 [Terriglobales bacterium]
MTRTTFSLLLIAVLAAAAVAPAQAPSGATAKQAPAATAKPAPAPAGPKAKSPEELAAVQAVAAALRNPTGTPAQLDAAVQNLVTKFPQTEFKEFAYTLATQYHYRHNDYAGTVENGEAALQANPHAVLPLLILASIIPQHVQSTDLDRDQRLAQAEGYDKTALDFADHFPAQINGHQLTPQEVAGYQQMIRGTAYSSLGAIATQRGQFPQAAGAYQQAIQYENGENQARDYYHLALAQDAAKQYKDALESIDKALQLGASNPTLQTLATAEKTKITRAMGVPAATHP